MSCNGRFQRRAGSINRPVFSFERGRRCPVALSTFNQQKIGKQVFVCRCETAPVRLPPHLVIYNGRFQRRAGSINRPIFSFEKGRRCLVALSAFNQQKIGKQVFVCRCETAPVRLPPHLVSCNGRFQRRAGSINRPIFSFEKGRRCLVALSAFNQQKIGKQVFVCRCETAPVRLPPAFGELQWALPATSWKHQSTRFQLQKGATLPRRPLRFQSTKDRVFVCVVKLLPFASPAVDELQWALPATSWKHQSTRLQLHKRARLPRRPLRHEQKRITSRYFISVCKLPNFVYQLHEVTCHLCSQRRACKH